MTRPDPTIDPRRGEAWYQQLRNRTGAWIAQWRPDSGGADFGSALMRIAARFDSEVTQRLDHVSTKAALGFLDWLAIAPRAGQPARLPVAFRVADTAVATVLAPAASRLQSAAGDIPVILETETDLDIVPASIAALVAVDPVADQIYLPPPPVLSMEAPPLVPTTWTLKSLAPGGSDKLQLTPALGLDEGTVLQLGTLEYQVTGSAVGDLVPIEPPLGTPNGALESASVGTPAVPQGSIIRAVRDFAPFDAATRGVQQHALYLGDDGLLNMNAKGSFSVAGATALATMEWSYWGTLPGDEPTWLKLNSLGVEAEDLVLQKDTLASVDSTEVNGVSSRWLRARLPPSIGGPPDDAIALSNLGLKINASARVPKPAPVDSPVLLGAANTAPLVMNQPFYPLGQIPRQFDAFYLGSDEAFSKTGARAKLNFAMADPTLGPLALADTAPTGAILYGVARDGALHRYRLDPSSLPGLSYAGPTRPSTVAGGGTPFEGAERDIGPVVQQATTSIAVFVAEKRRVWQWTESPQATAPPGSWTDCGAPGGDSATSRIAQLVVLGGGSLIARLVDQSVWLRDAGGSTWRTLGDSSLRLRQLMPIRDPTLPDREPARADQLLAINAQGRLASLARNSAGIWAVTATDATVTWTNTIAPLALVHGPELVVVGASSSGPDSSVADELSLLRFATFGAGGAAAFNAPQIVGPVALSETVAGSRITAGLLPGSGGGAANPFATLRVVLTLLPGDDEARGRLGWWMPFDAARPGLFVGDPPGDAGRFGQVPLLSGDRIVVPGTQRNILVNLLSTLNVIAASASASALHDGCVLRQSFDTGDILAVRAATLGPLGNSVSLGSDRWLYRPEIELKDGPARIFTSPSNLTPQDAVPARRHTILVLHNPPAKLAVGARLLITVVGASQPWAAVQVKTVRTGKDPATRRVTLDGPVKPATAGTTLQYVVYDSPNCPSSQGIDLAVRPVLSLAAILPAQSQTAAIAIDAGARIHFQAGAADPATQRVAEIAKTAAGEPLALLAEAWQTPPTAASTLTLTIQPQSAQWVAFTGDVSTNPNLSWEYWNGSGWWGFSDVTDQTADLKLSGEVSFTVPEDLRQTQVLGVQSFWIRARLVGGDYGRETYTIVTTPIAPPPAPPAVAEKQEVTINTDSVHPPIVVALSASYTLEKAVAPQHVLTFDSRSWSDESGANVTPGARIDTFMPVGLKLQRLTQQSPPLSAAPNGVGASGAPAAGCDGGLDRPAGSKSPGVCTCPGGCSCPGGSACRGGSNASAGSTSTLAAASAASLSFAETAVGRALYLGFAKPPQGSAVRLLFLVSREFNFGTSAPLIAEVLRGNRFEQVVSSDETRALGESGVVSLVISAPPTNTELFGMAGYWIRLRPKAAASSWAPSLRGVFVNGTWATAAETQALEIVGSADGSPGLSLFLSRPPVLAGSLELRVRELLGEEEIAALDPVKNSVRSDIADMPGTWVRWNEVIDPGDEEADARVFALDPVSGEIRFGDNQHGMIPQVGADAVVAFSYRRVSGAAANAVAAFDLLNLVTPIDGVESAIAADQAEGGSDPESAERVRQFAPARLRHRDRAVTLRDLQDMARFASADVVQALALASPRGARVVIASNANPPVPGNALCRAVSAYLLTRASPALARPGALRVTGPALIRFRVTVRLRVATLDIAGTVADQAQKAVEKLFDPAIGGLEQMGWPIGIGPTEDDIGACLLSAQPPIPFDEVIVVSFVLTGSAGGRTTLSVPPDGLPLLEPGGVMINPEQMTVPA